MKRLLAVLLVALGARVAFAETRLAEEEKQGLARIAQDWVELGKWCGPRMLVNSARLCAERALAADPAAPGVADFVATVVSSADVATEKDAAEWTKKAHEASRRIALRYDRIVSAGGSETDPPIVERLDGYVLLGLELDPDPKRWERTLGLIESCGPRARARAGRFAERALRLKPPEKIARRLQALADELAIQSPVLRTASGHPMRYYFSLPPGFERTKGKKWPILLALEGSGSFFEEAAKGWKDNRGKLGFIIVSPCTFANAGHVAGDEAKLTRYRKWYPDAVIDEASRKALDFDEQGILAVIRDLEATHDAESRVYLTGFSAGGSATWMMIQKHPGLLNAAAPVCAVSGHRGNGDQPAELGAEDKNFPVNIITGEKDERFAAGSDAAARALEKSGYANVKRTTVPGMGHSPAMVQVIDTFRPYLTGAKKRGDKQE